MGKLRETLEAALVVFAKSEGLSDEHIERAMRSKLDYGWGYVLLVLILTALGVALLLWIVVGPPASR